MKKTVLFLLILFILSAVSFGQNPKADKIIEKAASYIRQNQEEKAVNILKQATQTYSDYAPLYIFLGEIYYNKKDYKNSMEYYQKGTKTDKTYDLIAIYRLAKMQKLYGNYTEAKENFLFFIDNAKKTTHKTKVADCKFNIQCIDFILSQLSDSKTISFINLGSNINDSLYQYLPTLMLDNTLYFTQRENNKEDFYFAVKQENSGKEFVWQKKQRLSSPLNTSSNEGAASISPDGRYLYFAKCNSKDGFGSCDIYRSKKNGNSWEEPENLGPNVNSSSWDSQPSIASDGRTLFFVSNRKGGYGKSDIYYSYLKDDGNWTKAKNCGEVINTAGDELTPFIHPSNSILYFSSDSLVGMGGMDIYYSEIKDGKFLEPVNMGYPVNTSEDETCFTVSADGEFAVYSKNNPPEEMDLYAFYLPKELKPNKVITLTGKIQYADNKKGNESSLEIKNLTTGKIVTSTVSDKQNDSYLLALVSGEDYAMSVTCKGYLLYSSNFSLQSNENSELNENIIHKDILLKPIKQGESIVLNNIFFKTASFELTEQSTAELNTLFKLLNENKGIKVEISGHTDNIGSDTYNLNLSEKRAESVSNWLIEKGINAERITFKGFGSKKPIADNSTEEGRKMNRRTEFKILETE